MAPNVLEIPDLLLIIAEQVELPALWALMRTSRLICGTILQYEYSISRSFLKRAEFQPKTDLLRSTKDETPRAFPLRSFDGVAELDLRTRRIDEILSSQFLRVSALSPARCQACYCSSLRRALYLCDAASDLRASDLDSKHNHADPTVLEAHVEYLRSLSLTDAAFIAEVISQGSQAFQDSTKEHKTNDAEDGDMIYKDMAFQEQSLRWGSSFVWAFASESAPPGLRAQMDGVHQRGIEGIHAWESGVGPRLPSLRHTVLDSVQEKKKCEFGEVLHHVRLITHPESKES